MSIKFNCEHCGKGIVAPDEAGGKRGRCPYCQQSNYIPAPVAEEDILDLAPEEDEMDPKRKAEMELIRQQERAMLAEMGGPEEKEPLEQKDKVESNDVEHLVINYCIDLAGSNLDRAQETFNRMKRFRRACLDVTNDLLDGKKKEPALSELPPKLLSGILSQLRKQLQALK